MKDERESNEKIFVWQWGRVIAMLDIHQMDNAAFRIRSSHLRYSIKKVVLKNFANFTGKHLCQSFFFNKVAGLRLKNTSERLLL